MAIKKVIVTYDFSDETFEVLRRRDPGWLPAFTLEKMNMFDQQLFGNLELLDVDVEMFTHQEGDDIAGVVEEIGQEAESADLVFHETGRIAFEFDKSPWKEQYQKAIEELVHSRFLGKSSFRSYNRRYSDKDKAAKIARAAGLPMPKSYTVDEYFASDRPLPVVLKLIEGSLGDRIYFIDKHEQIERYFDREAHQRYEGRTPPPKNAFEVQEFIETPSNHFTHYRIFTIGDGTIIGAVLTYSEARKDQLERVADPDRYSASNIYSWVGSPVYMDCFPICSNAAQGGIQIPFDGTEESKPLTEEDREVLIAHGHNPGNPSLSPKLRDLAGRTAREFSKCGILRAGQDWLEDKNGNSYFLEINDGPGMEIFNTLFNRGEGHFHTSVAICTRKLALALKHYKK